jgi:hypothetical protein
MTCLKDDHAFFRISFESLWKFARISQLAFRKSIRCPTAAQHFYSWKRLRKTKSDNFYFRNSNNFHLWSLRPIFPSRPQTRPAKCPMRFFWKSREFREGIPLPNWRRLLSGNASYNRKERNVTEPSPGKTESAGMRSVQNHSKRTGFTKRLKLPSCMQPNITGCPETCAASRGLAKLSKNIPLLNPLENRDYHRRYQSGDKPAIRQTHFQGRVSKDGQMPLLSPQASHL